MINYIYIYIYIYVYVYIYIYIYNIYIYIYIYLSHLNLETRNVIGRNRVTCYKLICPIHRVCRMTS